MASCVGIAYFKHREADREGASCLPEISACHATDSGFLPKRPL